jgi:hypothetical protein
MNTSQECQVYYEELEFKYEEVKKINKRIKKFQINKNVINDFSIKPTDEPKINEIYDELVLLLDFDKFDYCDRVLHFPLHQRLSTLTDPLYRKKHKDSIQTKACNLYKKLNEMLFSISNCIKGYMRFLDETGLPRPERHLISISRIIPYNGSVNIYLEHIVYNQ